MTVCEQCGTENPDGFRFCGRCAAPLEPSTGQERRERRVVSILMADLQGFTSRSERLDVEDVDEFLAPYRSRLRRAVESAGGVVSDFAGDGMMAVFGAPVAHEDDAERAVRTAIAIRDWFLDPDSSAQQADLHVRLGVTSGEVLVTLTGDQVRATGDVVNTAARLEAAAPPDGVLVDVWTHRATSRAIRYDDAEPVTAKGKAKPVAAWVAVNPVSVLPEQQRDRLPLVGRETEASLLRQSLDRARAEPSTQLVSVIGEPGIGKSRLIDELFTYIDELPELVTVRRGRSLAYGEAVPSWALSEIVKAQAGILDSDSADVANVKLTAAVAGVVPDKRDREWVTRHLRPLVGLEAPESGGDSAHEEAFAAWRRFVEALAEDRTTVILFEDIHWADDALLDFIDLIADRAGAIPLLVVCTARPELFERREHWGGGKINAHTISLTPLSDEDTSRLVHGLLHQALLPAEVQATLLERAEGNPLYAQEYVRMLQDRGILIRDGGRWGFSSDVVDLPESLQGIIAARLDTLSADERGFLQDAAVVGRTAWIGAVNALTERTTWQAEELLHNLERKQLVHRVRRSSIHGDTEFQFGHALTKDVAYNQLPRSERGRRHLAAANWLESHGRAEDLAETLAHHYSAANSLLPPTSIGPEIGTRMRRAFSDAGERALALSAYPMAARYFQAALDTHADANADDASLRLGLGRAWFGVDGSGDSELRSALDEATSNGDSETAADAALALRVNAWYRGDSAEAETWLKTAFGVLKGRPDSRAKALALAELFRSNTASGHPEETIRLGPEALTLAERVGPESVRARILISIGTSRIRLGDPEGIEDIRRAIDVAQAAGALEQVHAGMNNLSSAQLVSGDLAAAVSTYEDLVEMVERTGREVDRRWARVSLANLRLAQGMWDDAIDTLDQFIAESESGTPHYLDGIAYCTRAQIRIARNDVTNATADTVHAVERGRQADLQILAATLAPRAAVLLDIGEVFEARSALDELLEHGPEIGRTADFSIVDLAWTAHDLGRVSTFRDLLLVATPSPWVDAARLIADDSADSAAELLTLLDYMPGAAYAHFRAAEQAVSDGRTGDARDHLNAAASIYADLRATRFQDRVESARAALTS